MHRYALLIEYDGAPFHGWQRQAEGRPSVQQRIETALAALGEASARVQGAGRTDAGVHAEGQVADVTLGREWVPERLRAAINAHLQPDPVAILAVARVGADFSARFSAVGRRYRYSVLCRAAPPVLERGRVWHRRQELDLEAMREAARHLIGRHDFTTFRATLCQARSPVRTLDRLDITTEARPGNGIVLHLEVEARSFLHNQVRSIVGTLERVGAGAWAPADVARALAARDRAACGPVAPPQGLCLTGVRYPADPFSRSDP
jgi:tRNA pseudouridine38-40 synthase